MFYKINAFKIQDFTFIQNTYHDVLVLTILVNDDVTSAKAPYSSLPVYK